MRAQRSQSRQVRELTNPDAVVHMEEKHRRRVERLLEEAKVKSSAAVEDRGRADHQDTSGDEGGSSSSGESKWLDVQLKLQASGFSEAHTEQVRAALILAEPSLTACMDWLCLHLPENGGCICARAFTQLT